MTGMLRRASKIVSMDRLRYRVLERENRAWDESIGVDTGGWFVPTEETTVREAADGFPYAATHVRLARAVLESLRPVAEGATFVDLGSGKGRMLLLAAELPFADVLGIEYSRELHATAVKNLAAAKVHGQGVRARLELGDVREFSFPPTPLVAYFNNPFPETVMREVIRNLSASYEQLPRPITLVYQELRHEDTEHRTLNRQLIDQLPFLTPWPLTLRGLLNRALLRPYLLTRYASPQVRAASHKPGDNPPHR